MKLSRRYFEERLRLIKLDISQQGPRRALVDESVRLESELSRIDRLNGEAVSDVKRQLKKDGES